MKEVTEDDFGGVSIVGFAGDVQGMTLVRCGSSSY